MKLGKLAYKLYFQPKARIAKALQQGLYNTYIIDRENKAMRQQALLLKAPQVATTQSAYEIHFLTGEKYWYQTAFCAYSFMKWVSEPVRLVIHDDRSIDEALRLQIQHQFPGTVIHGIEEIEQRLDVHLPVAKFPYLRQRRFAYPHIRKLTDVHAGATGWKLLLDSDMLFFRQPALMLEWLKNPQHPFHLLDCDNAYGYSFELMESLVGHTIPQKLNVGAIGIRSETIDWEKLEYWAKTLEAREGSSYYQEQALWAMLVAGQACTVAPAVDYVVLPEREEVLQPQTILHHYVADSKEWYFKFAWKKFL